MYINPFAAGIVVTIISEIALLIFAIAVSIMKGGNDNDNRK